MDTIKKVEAGDRWPSPETLEAIADGLGLQINDLFESKNARPSLVSVSSVAKKISSIPDEVYDFAEKLSKGTENGVWVGVIATLEAQVDQEEKEVKAKSKA